MIAIFHLMASIVTWIVMILVSITCIGEEYGNLYDIYTTQYLSKFFEQLENSDG